MGTFVHNAKQIKILKRIKKLESERKMKPDYYKILDFEVKDLNKEILDKIEASDFKMTLNEAGWYQQAMQYLFRFYGKNGLEDLKKAREALNILIESIEKHETK